MKTQLPAKPYRRRRRIWPRVLLLLIFAGAAAAGGWYYELQRPPPDDSRLVLEGNVDVRQVNLSFKVDGRIETLSVDEGDTVTAGQVLATLDKRYFDDELRLARARRDAQQAAVARLEHGSRPEEIAQGRGQSRRDESGPEKRQAVHLHRQFAGASTGHSARLANGSVS